MKGSCLAPVPRSARRAAWTGRAAVAGLLLAWLTPALSAQPAPTRDTLALGAALSAALAHAPELEAARAGVAAAEAGTDEARAAWLPSLTGSGRLDRFQEPMVVAPLHGFDPGTPPEFDRTLAHARLSLGWTLFDGGARGARVRAARARAEGAAAGAEDTRMETTLNLLEAYLRLRGARDALATEDAREADLEAERARADRFVAEGRSPRLELLRAEAALEAARADAVRARSARAVAEAELARLVGLPPERVAEMALAEVRVSAGPAPRGEVAADHPLLVGARGRATAAAALVREARSAWLPRLTGTGAYVEYGSGAGGFTGEWQAGLQLEYPLFSGGARRARVEAARAEARRAEAQVRGVEHALASNVDRAAAGLADARARVEALERALTRFEELTRIEALALAEGAGVQADYLRALAGMHGARFAVAEARRATVLARARLARAEGTLDPEWIRTHLEEDR